MNSDWDNEDKLDYEDEDEPQDSDEFFNEMHPKFRKPPIVRRKAAQDGSKYCDERQSRTSN